MAKLTLSEVIQAIENGEASLVIERISGDARINRTTQIEIAVIWAPYDITARRDVLVAGQSLVAMAPEIMRLAR